MSDNLGAALPRKLLALLQEVGLIILLCLVAYLAVCLLSYSPDDPGPMHTGSTERIANLGGRAGAWFADLMFNLLGRSAYLSMPLLCAMGWRAYIDQRQIWSLSSLGCGVALVGACGLEHIYFPLTPARVFEAGGIIGDYLSVVFVANFGVVGATVIFLGLLTAGITLVTHLSWFALMDEIGYQLFSLLEWLKNQSYAWNDRRFGAKLRRQRRIYVKQIRDILTKQKPPTIEQKIEPLMPSEMPRARPQQAQQTSLLVEATPPPVAALPPLSLLDTPGESSSGYSRDELASMSQLLVKKLKDFNVDISVIAVQPGPVITRFEIEPAAGVKASTIVGLARDLARSLSVDSVRVVENIPGKSVVGIEIPNQHREMVRLIEGLASMEYAKSGSPLSLVLGKDIAGHAVITDLMKMPHLLIAGATGAGKSVCVNALILSLVYKSTPAEVRLIMVDPKFLELSGYDGIPHLLAPVVTDMSKASNALRWCIVEMDRRFHLMAEVGVRNIAGYNKLLRVTAKTAHTQPYAEQPAEGDAAEAAPASALPYIVVIVDELADLMMVAGKKIEEIIIRIAQRARAAGIHLVLATQRPSVDVVTGLIKANVPTRIAFRVSSRADSRTVLDQMGAEQLLGQGDMLFLPPGNALPQRVHGSFISDQEVAKVVAELKRSGSPVYLDEITDGITDGPAAGSQFTESSDGPDPLYDAAVKFVTQSRRASISAVQRELRVGYNRAARMIETMQQDGVVTPPDNGKREVLAPPPPSD